MSVCTFFGHHDCPSEVKPKLREALTDLIENHLVDIFYVGNKGAYDRMVRSILRELAQKYAHIHYAVVLERMPGKRNEDIPEDYSGGLFRYHAAGGHRGGSSAFCDYRRIKRVRV